MQIRNFLSLLTLSVWVAVSGGCSEQVTRVSLSGTVSFDGEPIEDGQIAFEPLGEGKMEFGIITKGEYTIPKEFGLVPGKYLVRITGNRPTGKKAEPSPFLKEGDSLEIYEQYIPLEFNTGSKLKVKIEAERELQKDFAISSTDTE